MCPARLALAALACCCTASCTQTTQRATTRPARLLPGFELSRHFGEQIRQYRVEPGIQVLVNAPAADAFDPARPTRIVFFALPNGNTTAQTIGRRPGEGVDWHYNIQHIGAQTRRVREVVTDANIVVAYLEADGKSWPAWKQKHADYRELITRAVDSVKELFRGYRRTVELAAHSGGGSLILGFLDAAGRIPADVTRIIFLDANYGYSDEDGHGDKLIRWLADDRRTRLCVIAYDDRDVKLDGKPIVGPAGGTYRKTRKMVERLSRDMALTLSEDETRLRWRGSDGRVDIIILKNPTNAILHTALVGDKNGFIHALTTGTAYEDRAAIFSAPRAYTRWIQPD